jgi:hypothetical protein
VAKSVKDDDWDWARALMWVAYRERNKIDHAARYWKWAETRKDLATRHSPIGTHVIEAYFRGEFDIPPEYAYQPETELLFDANYIENLRDALKRGTIVARVIRIRSNPESGVTKLEWHDTLHFHQVSLPVDMVKRAFRQEPLSIRKRAMDIALAEECHKLLGKPVSFIQLAEKMAELLSARGPSVLSKPVFQAWDTEFKDQLIALQFVFTNERFRDGGRLASKQGTLTKNNKKAEIAKLKAERTKKLRLK